MKLSHYQILGIPENADAKQIKAAYRSMAKRFHPDTNQGSEAAAELFRQLSEAYRVLGDDQLRKSYDQKILRQQKKGRKEQRKTAPKSDPQQKFNNFLYSVLGAILEMPNEPTPTIQPQNRASPPPAQKKVRQKPDFDFYYYLAMERKNTPYSCGEDGIYRRSKPKRAGPVKPAAFGRAPGSSFVLLLLSGLWELFKQ